MFRSKITSKTTGLMSKFGFYGMSLIAAKLNHHSDTVQNAALPHSSNTTTNIYGAIISDDLFKQNIHNLVSYTFIPAITKDEVEPIIEQIINNPNMKYDDLKLTKEQQKRFSITAFNKYSLASSKDYTKNIYSVKLTKHPNKNYCYAKDYSLFVIPIDSQTRWEIRNNWLYHVHNGMHSNNYSKTIALEINNDVTLGALRLLKVIQSLHKKSDHEGLNLFIINKSNKSNQELYDDLECYLAGTIEGAELAQILHFPDTYKLRQEQNEVLNKIHQDSKINFDVRELMLQNI